MDTWVTKPWRYFWEISSTETEAIWRSNVSCWMSMDLALKTDWFIKWFINCLFDLIYWLIDLLDWLTDLPNHRIAYWLIDLFIWLFDWFCDQQRAKPGYGSYVHPLCNEGHFYSRFCDESFGSGASAGLSIMLNLWTIVSLHQCLKSIDLSPCFIYISMSMNS